MYMDRTLLSMEEILKILAGLWVHLFSIHLQINTSGYIQQTVISSILWRWITTELERDRATILCLDMRMSRLRQARLGCRFLTNILMRAHWILRSWAKIALSLSDNTYSPYACPALSSEWQRACAGYSYRVSISGESVVPLVISRVQWFSCVVGATLVAAPFAQVTIPTHCTIQNHGFIIPFCVIKRFLQITPVAECAAAIDNDVVLTGRLAISRLV